MGQAVSWRATWGAAAAVGAVLLLGPCCGANEAAAVSHTATTQPLAGTELSCDAAGRQVEIPTTRRLDHEGALLARRELSARDGHTGEDLLARIVTSGGVRRDRRPCWRMSLCDAHQKNAARMRRRIFTPDRRVDQTRP